ncbi:MAG TPA: hypothetical protein VD757_00900 [Candidatus Nitrosocosmicus sp.]|nr:hypothetical protein [Candidatus Nitrosocosmicus sp.]
MKTRLGLRLTALLVALMMIMTGCATAPASTAQEAKPEATPQDPNANTLTVWAWDANFNIPIMKLAAEYYQKAGHPDFKLEVIEMGANDVKQKLITSFASGTSEGLPDIVLQEDYTAPNLLSSYKGKYADLTDSIDFKNFAQYKVNTISLDGRTYGVPFDAGTAGLYYRTDLLEQAGYKAEDMQNLTWSKFVKIGEDVKKKTGKWFIAMKPNTAKNYFQIAMQSAGLWYFNADGSTNIVNNPAIREMMDVMKEVSHKKLAKEVDYWSAEGVGAITGGEAAAALTAVWYVPTILSAKDQVGKWAVTRIPTLETVPGATNASNIGGSSWFVLEESKKKELAVDFLKTVYAGNNDFYQQILTERGAVGTYIPAQSGMAYTTPVEQFGGQKVYEDFSNWSKEVPSISYGTYTDEAAASVAAVLQDYYDGKLTKDQALQQAEENLKMQIGK